MDNKALNKMFVVVTEDVNKLLTFQILMVSHLACLQ
jgi:hypothetical protein